MSADRERVRFEPGSPVTAESLNAAFAQDARDMRRLWERCDMLEFRVKWLEKLVEILRTNSAKMRDGKR